MPRIISLFPSGFFLNFADATIFVELFSKDSTALKSRFAYTMVSLPRASITSTLAFTLVSVSFSIMAYYFLQAFFLFPDAVGKV